MRNILLLRFRTHLSSVVVGCRKAVLNRGLRVEWKCDRTIPQLQTERRTPSVVSQPKGIVAPLARRGIPWLPLFKSCEDIRRGVSCQKDTRKAG